MKDVDVRARSTEDVLAISIAIAASGLVGVGGAVTVVVIDNETYAYVGDGARVLAGGNLVVAASDQTDIDVVAIAAGIGIGAAGIGAGVGVTAITKDTRAWIGNATVDAKGDSSEILALRRQPLPAHLGRRRARTASGSSARPTAARSAAWPWSPSRARASSRSRSPARAASGRASPARSPSR